MITDAIVKPAPKVGQVFNTQFNDRLGMAVRVDNKPNGNLAIQYLKLSENGDGTYTTSLELAWTTWYTPKYEKPKYGKVSDFSTHENIVNDAEECSCRNCDYTIEVDGVRDTEEQNVDRFGASGHYQTSEFYRTFTSVWKCPICQTMNKEEIYDAID